MKNYLILFLVLINISCNSNKKQTIQSETTKIWQIENYTNKWGEEINLSYVIGHFEGTFSNSAVTDAHLSVDMLINKKDISIRFYEYGDKLNNGEGEAFIIVRDKNKKEFNERDDNGFHDGSLELWGKSQAMVRSALLKGGRVMFIIGIKNHGISLGSYRFEVPNADGLKETLAKTRYYK